jgi:hypothetical protein
MIFGACAMHTLSAVHNYCIAAFPTCSTTAVIREESIVIPSLVALFPFNSSSVALFPSYHVPTALLHYFSSNLCISSDSFQRQYWVLFFLFLLVLSVLTLLLLLLLLFNCTKNGVLPGGSITSEHGF